MKDQIKVALLGEVDCGKSTLTGRLLYDTNSISSQAKKELAETCTRLGRELEFAYLLDSFEEERLEEFTLDTTQAFLKLKGREILLIDVPGHRELLKNMLTGTSYAHAAVLVVDVRKSLEQQTRRHLYILKFLGIDEVIFTVNKMDLVGYSESSFRGVKKQINTFLEEIGIKSGYVIPVSAKEGENLLNKSLRMPWYDGLTLVEALNNLKKEEQIYDFRFSIQDIYETEKEKTAVGLIHSGKIRNGDLVKIPFLDTELKIKKIRVFGKNQRSAEAKENIGIEFICFQKGLRRGGILYKGSSPKATDKIQAKIFCLHDLGTQEEILLRITTEEVSVKIDAIEESIDTATLESNNDLNKLKSTDAASVMITAARPVVVERFQDLPSLGRFVLEKNNEIYAVGIIC